MQAPDVEEHDPFLAFNEAMNPGAVVDPYPELARRRADGPVQPITIDPALYDGPEAPIYEVLGYDAVQEVLRDAAAFSSAGYDDSIGPIMGHTILAMDEPEHRAYRSLVQQAFSRKALESWETELVVPTVDRLETVGLPYARAVATMPTELMLTSTARSGCCWIRASASRYDLSDTSSP